MQTADLLILLSDNIYIKSDTVLLGLNNYGNHNY